MNAYELKKAAAEIPSELNLAIDFQKLEGLIKDAEKETPIIIKRDNELSAFANFLGVTIDRASDLVVYSDELDPNDAGKLIKNTSTCIEAIAEFVCDETDSDRRVEGKLIQWKIEKLTIFGKYDCPECGSLIDDESCVCNVCEYEDTESIIARQKEAKHTEDTYSSLTR